MKNTIFYKAARKVYHKIKKSKEEFQPLNKKKFIRKIKKYKVISFDMFDTLISRTIYEPDDLFLILSEKIEDKDFLKKRKEAEKHAREKLKKDVNLDEIYASYKELYHEDTNDIQNLEEELELEYCIPRKDMLEIVKDLIKEKKKVIITSDMYLNKRVLERMLKKCGYEGNYKIYLSNEINKRKDDKSMWEYLRNEYKGKRICHIGDNNLSDVVYPREFQIASFKILSGKEIFQKSSLYQHLQEKIKQRSTSDSLYLGEIINKGLCNSPFSDLKIHSLEEFAWLFYGPILDSFLKFITENTSSNDYLLFLAREGYYLQDLYKTYIQENHLQESNNLYFLASRKATSLPSVYNIEDFKTFIPSNYEGSLHKFFQKNFQFDLLEEDEPIMIPQDISVLQKYLNKYQKEILKKASKQREYYQEYLEKEINNYKKKNLIMVDLGYSGSIQYYLTSALNYNFKGLYLASSENIKKKNEHSELTFMFDAKEKEEYLDIYHYSLVLEYFLTAPFGQFQGFEKQGNNLSAIYNEEIMDEKKKQNVEIILKEVKEFIRIQAQKKKYQNLFYDKDLLWLIYKYIIEENYLEKEVKDLYSFMDSYSREEEKNVFQIIGRY